MVQLIDDGSRDRELEEAFNAHFAALDTVVKQQVQYLVAFLDVQSLGIMAAINHQAGESYPVAKAFEQRELVVHRLQKAGDDAVETADEEEEKSEEE